MVPARDRSDRLDSWKAIAAYLGRTEKTARRWEVGEGLPVHRLVHQERGSVYAFRHELDAWHAGRNGNGASIGTTPPTVPVIRRTSIWLGLATALVAGAAGFGYWVSSDTDRPQTLAVLPFTIDSSDPSLSHLGPFVAETIVEKLTRAPDLRVRPFAWSLRLASTAEGPSAIGKKWVLTLSRPAACVPRTTASR